jgi:hypothetical protein
MYILLKLIHHTFVPRSIETSEGNKTYITHEAGFDMSVSRTAAILSSERVPHIKEPAVHVALYASNAALPMVTLNNFALM